MSPEIIHSIIIVVGIFTSHIITVSYLGNYDIQFAGIVFVVYYVFKKLIAKNRFPIIDSLAATIIISTIVSSTDGLASPFFFLNYFLIFSLSLLLEPIISVSTTLALVALYLLSTPETKPLNDYIPLFSLPFLTPFALFLGEQYKQIIKKNKQISDSYFFMSLVMKNHLKRLGELTQNFLGDHELTEIKKTATRMEQLIDEYEKKQ